MPNKLVRLGIVIVTLILGIFLLSSLFKSFSHFLSPDQTTPPAVETNAPNPQ
ncbi:hypothetical protein [Acetobacter indonesiensis]|uniref:hypothetical protein n=1 Tax=Acetobacter indonesiensis TaxID=104101 RepID=UPI0015C50ABD|nr:hypothetical protein [Acetobacter indonesiensis]